MRRNQYLVAITLASVLALTGGVGAIAGESISGVFKINNTLPSDAELMVRAYAEVSEEPVATQEVSAVDGKLEYEFSGLGAGAHHVDLVASVAEVELVLSRQKPGGIADAVGVDGAVSGAVTMVGELPSERLLMVRADRVDIEVSGMPDQLNRLSYEVEKDEIVDNRFEYQFEGMSYGIYRLELIGYDYQTHKVEVYGALAGKVVIDAGTPSAMDQMFEVELVAGE